MTDNHTKDVEYKEQRTVDWISETYIVVLTIESVFFHYINLEKSVTQSNWQNNSEFSNADLIEEKYLVNKTA